MKRANNTVIPQPGAVYRITGTMSELDFGHDELPLLAMYVEDEPISKESDLKERRWHVFAGILSGNRTLMRIRMPVGNLHTQEGTDTLSARELATSIIIYPRAERLEKVNWFIDEAAYLTTEASNDTSVRSLRAGMPRESLEFISKLRGLVKYL